MSRAILVQADLLASRLSRAFAEAGASAPAGAAATRALMHASRLGVDSHGARLVMVYDQKLRNGRANRNPVVTARRTAAAAAIVDGDNGLGALAAYRAMELAIEIARESGIGAVGVVRSHHYGAAGAYATVAAEAGLIGFATTNADSIVAPFEGAQAFHGTNPLAFAAPVEGQKPWLLDMATSSIPFNRVLLYRSLATILPEGVAADRQGQMTRDAEVAEMLMPLGGAGYGFKGAALAGVATLLSAILMGTTLDHAMIPMVGTPDLQTPRNMGHFVIAIDPAFFAGKAMFDKGMRSYLDALRAVRHTDGGHPVMAPGDREWAVEAERLRNGIPIDPDTAAFLKIGADGTPTD
ncbi:Ldh family oxidoreductase [Lichenihabitans psoromatis]|uniref:Ldh family oxidoreductase n=1 Tax=Lichenihabitans psoromatis TaxID=2528642 RepID=UPI001038562C|nr:Ldh family oxidoreductase [Lichenihabitans psoromatis]